MIVGCRPDVPGSDLCGSLRSYADALGPRSSRRRTARGPRPRGMYEMRLHDPDGNVLRVGSPPA